VLGQSFPVGVRNAVVPDWKRINGNRLAHVLGFNHTPTNGRQWRCALNNGPGDFMPRAMAPTICIMALECSKFSLFLPYTMNMSNGLSEMDFPKKLLLQVLFPATRLTSNGTPALATPRNHTLLQIVCVKSQLMSIGS